MIPYKETINTTITITFVNFFSTPASRFLFLLNFYIHSCIFFPCFITFSSLWSPLIHFISNALFLLPLTLCPSSLFSHLFVPWHHRLIFSFSPSFLLDALLFSCLSTHSLFKLSSSAFVCASIIIQSDLGFSFVHRLHLSARQSCTV